MHIRKSVYNKIVTDVINEITKGDKNYDAVTAFLELCGKTFYEYIGNKEEVDIESEEYKSLMSRCMQTMTSKAPKAFTLIFKFFDMLSARLNPD